jgi:hypothetical protein
MLKLKTDITIEKPSFQIKYEDTILSMGSCFAQNVATKLDERLYKTCINPFGVLYNPFSIRNSLALLLNNYTFEKKDLFEHKGVWNSFQHHSSFSNLSAASMLHQINEQLDTARLHLKNTTVLCLTFGTAWVYELRKTNKVVSNCHRVPRSKFRRRRLTVTEIVQEMSKLLLYLKEKRPHLQVVLTVSPIRHLKDGFVENQISKSTLLLAIHQLIEHYDYMHYFPAYEIMQDDLRDYRFYEKDLTHPNTIAIDYIWDLFATHYLSDKEDKTRAAVEKLRHAAAHKPFQPTSLAHQKFVQKQLKTIAKLQHKLPPNSTQKLERYFENQLI